MFMKSLGFNEKVFFSLLKSSFVQIDRHRYLTQVLSPYCTNNELDHLSAVRPEEFVSTDILDKLADQILKEHLKKTTLFCSGSSLLGKVSLYLSIPADFASFFGNLLIMTQKLAYIYGWDSSFFGNEPTKETLSRLKLILGYAMGEASCRYPILDVSCDKLPSLEYVVSSSLFNFKEPLSRKLLIEIAKQFLKAIFAGATSKKLPLLGSGVGATWSYYTYRQMAIRIHSLLRESMYYRLEHDVV